jgi:hypothetical protein
VNLELSCAVALKEWDAQVRALLEGRTAVLVRKGGIFEQREGFQVQRDQFWLYPTFLHQNAGELNLEYQANLRPDLTPGAVALSAYASVAGVLKLEAVQAARAFETVQALNADTLERRFHYKNRPVLHALLLRVYRAAPQTVIETPAIKGCISWVDLEPAVPVRDARAVLSDAQFNAERLKLETLFGQFSSIG